MRHSPSVSQYFAMAAVTGSSWPARNRSIQLSRKTRPICASVLHSASLKRVFWKSIHHLREPFTFSGTEEIRSRNMHIVEENLAGILRVPANFFERPANAVTRKILRFDDDERHALEPGSFGVGLHGDADDAAERSVGDERLRAIYDVVVAFSSSGGLDACQV